jgi:hypothetical protein
MRTVLFAWELGGGFGHIGNIRRYAKRLAAHGLRMVAAVRNPELAQPLPNLGIEILKAPPWPEASFTRKQRAAMSSATLGDSLASAGLADADALKRILEDWKRIYGSVDPNLVVADYAPAAALAARRRIPLMMVGNGYTLPPSEMTHFPLLHRKAEIVFEEMRIVTIVNKVARPLGIEAIERLPQLFSADGRVVETFSLLDPYDLQRSSPADGPSFDSMPIAKRENANDILVYLAPGYTIRRDIISALLPVAGRVRIFACLVVHFGGSGLAAHALAAGVPQLVVASHIEQELNGFAVERAKLGRLVKGYEAETAIAGEVISELLENSELAKHAAQSGEAHRDMLRHSDALAAFETKSLKLLRL